MQASVPVSPSGSSWRLTQENWVLVSNSGVPSVLVPARTRIIHSLLHLVMPWPVIHGGNSLIPGGIWCLPATVFQLILTPKSEMISARWWRNPAPRTATAARFVKVQEETSSLSKENSVLCLPLTTRKISISNFFFFFLIL